MIHYNIAYSSFSQQNLTSCKRPVMVLIGLNLKNCYLENNVFWQYTVFKLQKMKNCWQSILCQWTAVYKLQLNSCVAPNWNYCLFCLHVSLIVNIVPVNYNNIALKYDINIACIDCYEDYCHENMRSHILHYIWLIIG